MAKVIMGLSGGMDSTTLLGILLNKGHEVHCCMFTYGSKHNKYEEGAVRNIIEAYKEQGFEVPLYKIDLTSVFALAKSNLLLSGGPIPEGHYEDPVMLQTVVPGRNLIFISIMASIAESIDADMLAIGVHSGDRAIYPDCREEFIADARSAVLHSTEYKIQLVAPFLPYTKVEILRDGMAIGVPYEFTRTCYKDQPVACGKCGSCQERLEAFRTVGRLDPVTYEML